MILGGAQENTLLTLESLKKSTDWELHLAYGPELDEGNLALEAQKLGIQTHCLQHLKRNLDLFEDIRAFNELCDFFDQRNFDIVHTHSSKAGILGRLAARQSAVPKIVHTIHGLAFDEYQSPFNRFIYSTAEKFASHYCDAIITVCETMKEQALQAGISRSVPIETIYSGFHLEAFLNVKPNPDNRRFVIGSVARMFPNKGHEDLMLLAEKLLPAAPEVDFHIVGDGPLLSEWQQWLQQHPELKSRITFAGRVLPGEVPFHLSKMHLLVHLSIREGLPRTVAQAMAAGLPVCVYDIGGSREVVINGLTGYLIKPRNLDEIVTAINELRSNRGKCLLLGSKGREMVANLFSQEIMGNKIARIYQELCNINR